jgi:protease-4
MQFFSRIFKFLVSLFIGLIIISVIFSFFYARGDKVGVLEIKGLISDSTEINKAIHDFKDREDIKAIVLRIDSPGGAVGPSQEIYKEVKKVKEKNKVVIASMGSVAASGGYYIAAAADQIVANPGTITGSIGVIIEFANVQELLDKIGLKGVVIKSGKFKDTGSPLREMRDEEKNILQGLINDIHQQFVDVVATNRKLDLKEVSDIADGRIFSGVQAKEANLVDELGNLEDAIDLASKLAGIEGKPQVVYSKRPKTSLFDFVFGKGLGSFFNRSQQTIYPPLYLLRMESIAYLN